MMVFLINIELVGVYQQLSSTVTTLTGQLRSRTDMQVALTASDAQAVVGGMVNLCMGLFFNSPGHTLEMDNPMPGRDISSDSA
jgi:hypothetical protein